MTQDFDDVVQPDETVKNSLSFTDLQPKEELTFDLPDGSKIPFKQPEAMSAEDHARLVSLEKRMEGVFEKLQKNYRDKDAVASYDNFTAIFVRFVLPDIPEAFLSGLTAGQRMKIIGWWRDNTASDTKKG